VRVLFIGPLPEPITGQALACQIFLDELVKHHSVDVMNINKKELRQGVSSLARIVQVARMVANVWCKRNSAAVTYFTPSESFAGNLRDLLIYLLFFKRLSSMVVHLNGGAGMREIMLKKHPLRGLNEFFLRRIGAVVVLGDRLVPIYANAVARERIHIVPNCAEDHLFSDLASINRKFRDVTPLRFLFLSNLIPGKGHEELVDAFHGLDDRVRESIVIDIAGDFQSEREKRDFLQKVAGVSQIRYHGTVRGSRRKELFHNAHVFCLPTYYPYEGQPLSILEAYASGCAVITTDHSGIRDVFAHEANGFEVAKRSSTDLAAAIRRAIGSPGTLHAIAATNFRTAELKYRTSTYNANMLRVIESVGTASSL